MTQSRLLRIVHTESSCGWGGQEIRILNETQGLMARGHQVRLLCVENSNLYKAALQRNIPVVGLPIARKRLAGVLALLRWLRSNPVDVVNTHSSTDSWLVALARLAYKVPVVRTRHVSAPIATGRATRWLYNRGCDFVVTTGEQLREHVLERTGLPSIQARSVPTGIDLSQFVPGEREQARQVLGLPVTVPIIGIVATIRTWKGHEYLLEALSCLNCPDVRVLIVGEGPNQANVEAAVARLGLEKQVLFAGQQADVVPWLQAMDVFALPSYANEGVPQSLMQAMACGLPVVSTPVGSIGELVRHGENGLLVAPRNAPELATALKQLLDDTALAQRLAVKGRETVVGCFSLEGMLNAMENIFLTAVPTVSNY